jgi:hypothetical protein
MATVMATTWVIATAKRVVGNKEGNGNSGKNNCNGNKSGTRATAMRVMATATATIWAMAMATTLAGNNDGKAEGSKGNGDSDEGGRQRRG